MSDNLTNDKKSSEVKESSTKINGKQGPDFNEWKAKRRELFEDKKRVEEESLESTKETLSLIIESEKIGVKTGRELIRQKETLNKVEDKLETINGSLDESQRHLKSMKSFFSSFKTYFNKKSNQVTTKKCEKDLSQVKNFEFNPVIDTIAERNAIECNSKDGTELNDTLSENKETIDYWNESKQINDRIEENLNEIDLGVERLKQLSLSLGHEIDSQNCLIDRITKETERAELRVKHQNNEMKQLLRK